jgi:hypothetical protein
VTAPRERSMQKKSLGSFCLAVVLELGLAYGPPGCAQRDSLATSRSQTWQARSTWHNGSDIRYELVLESRRAPSPASRAVTSGSPRRY